MFEGSSFIVSQRDNISFFELSLLVEQLALVSLIVHIISDIAGIQLETQKFGCKTIILATSQKAQIFGCF